MRVFLKIKTISVIFILFALTGCTSTHNLSSEDRANLKSVSVSEKVTKGQAFLLAPSGANVGLMFGAVGGALASDSIEDSQIAFYNYLEKNSISIEKIVREEFEQELRSLNKFPVKNSAEAGAASINITVPQYGFGVTQLLSSNVVPVLQVKCDMVDASGKLLWSNNERILPSIASPMDSIAWSELQNNPKLIEEHLRKAARYLAKNILASL